MRELLMMGNYEDAIILSRSILECYLSARYFDEKFDAETLRDRVTDPYAFMLTALCHDFGKAKTTVKGEDGRIRSIGHETAGLRPITNFLNRITNDERVKRYVLSMVPWHMKPNIYIHDQSKEKSTDNLFDSVPAPKDIIYLSMADKGMSEEDAKFLFERYESWKQEKEIL